MSRSMQSVTLDLGVFGEQEVDVFYDFYPAEKGNWMEPSVPATFEIAFVCVGGVVVPSYWWDNPVCVDLIKDVISSTQED